MTPLFIVIIEDIVLSYVIESIFLLNTAGAFVLKTISATLPSEVKGSHALPSS